MSTEDHPEALPLSAVLGRPVRSPQGEVLGKVQDLIVRPGTEPYPALTGLVSRTSGRSLFIPWRQVESLGIDGIRLSSAQVDLRPFARREGELLLGRDLLDRKVIDVERHRVVRVNEVLLRGEGGVWRLVGVDVGLFAVLRRLGLHAAWLRRSAPLDWNRVEIFASEVPVRLAVSHAKIADLHPADIADVLDSASLKQGREILQALDDETAADALEEVAPERQANLVESLDDERAADILEKMGPDDAADLLADLPEERAGDILERMEPEESEEVRELLRYPEESAGGIMTTDFLAIPRHFTAGQVLEHLRSLKELPEMVYYIYVVASEEDDRLVGIVSLRELLVAPPEQRVSDIMCTDFIAVPVTTSDREVARTMARYNLLALPVIDEEGHLQGIVTVDDAMEIILPNEWKKKIPRVFR